MKVLTTHDDPAIAVSEGLEHLLGAGPAVLAEAERLVHGTTLVTNAVVTHSGVRTGMLTTAGFRDVIEMRRENRSDLYDLLLESPEPLVPRRLRLEVRERLAADGRIREPLDEDAVLRAIRELRANGVISVAVCFLHSFRNPQHERRVRELVRSIEPDLSISLSSEVAPIVREYERFSTTVINAYTQPIMEEYVSRLESHLRSQGFAGEFLLMLSNGGVAPADNVARFPVRVLESGPAAGMIAAGAVAHAAGARKAIGFDMGGTTAKVCIVQDGTPHVRTQFEVARNSRLKRGSGYPVALPVIDMIEIGAGGGSIARLDAVGLVQVGPESAESHPGPACYGFGGTEATVTDADLVLGYLDPEYFVGGAMSLNVDAARTALRRLGETLGIDEIATAWAIHETVNESMATAVKIHLTEKGEDPRRYSLIAFGGAGPMHAYGVATKLGISTVIVPPNAGVESALGLISSPLSFEIARTYETRLTNLSVDELNVLIAELEAEAARLLGVESRQAHANLGVAADMRYVGQTHTLTVAVPSSKLPANAGEQLRSVFETAYAKQYGHAIDGHADVEVINWRVTVSVPRSSAPGSNGSPPSAPQPVPRSSRKVFFGPSRANGVECPSYLRRDLPPALRLQGPLVIEEESSTALVGQDGIAMVDDRGNLIIRVGRLT